MPVSHAKSDTLADWSGVATVNNSTGGTITVQGSDLVRPSDWNSNHVVSLSASEVAPVLVFGTGVTSSTAADGISVGLDPYQFFEPYQLGNTNSTVTAPGVGTWYLDGPYVIDKGIPAGGYIFTPVTNAAGFLQGSVYSAASTGSVSKFQTFYHNIAFYRQGSGASTSRLELAYSNFISFQISESYAVSSTATSQVQATHALTLSVPSQFDSAGNITYGSSSKSGSSSTAVSTMASSAIDATIASANSLISGARLDIIPMTTALTPDVYWFAHMFTSTSSTNGTGSFYGAGTMIGVQSRVGMIENNLGAYKRLGATASNSSTYVLPMHGFLATTTSGASSIINTSNVKATTGRAYWVYFQTTY